jgi:Asp-tRNA(Asn)/Glu-tRNA(Gln) amidotransferase A subunit family amidase
MATNVADVALMWSALTGAAVPEARVRGLTVGVLTRPPSVGGPPAAENRAAEQYVARLEELGAIVVEASIPEPPEDTWPLFFHEAGESHRATFPSRADEYGDNVRVKLEHAQTIGPAEADRARESVRRWREYRPDVDLYVAPTIGVEVPPEDSDELEVRIPLTAFLRPFNVIGWAGLSIGDVQFVAPRDEVVLAAGLAWQQR